MSAESIINWALQTGIAITILIVLILIIRRPIARAFGANAAYALWLLPVVRLFMPSIIIEKLPETLPSFIPQIQKTAADIIPPAAVFTAPEMPNQAYAQAANLNINLIIVCLWLGIAILWFGAQIALHVHQMKQLKETSAATSADMNEDIAYALEKTKLRTTPHIRISNGEVGPLVSGIGKPIVILPHSFSTYFTLSQQRFALIHEFAHIKRRDLGGALIALAFRALNWPNPLVHIAARFFREDQEAACDAFALKAVGKTPETKHSYVQTLIRSANLTHRPRFGHKTDTPLGLSLTASKKEKNNDT